MEIINENSKNREPESLEFNFDHVQIPNKMFFKIGEVAEITGLKPYVLRFWETEFKDLAPQKASNKQRKYTRQEIEKLLLIKKLLYQEKFTIEGAKSKLKEIKAGGKTKLAPKTKPDNEFKKKQKRNLEYIKRELLKIQKEIKASI